MIKFEPFSKKSAALTNATALQSKSAGRLPYLSEKPPINVWAKKPPAIAIVIKNDASFALYP